jgi:hypothetical protein
METKLSVLTSAAYIELVKTFGGMQDVIMENTIREHEGAYAARARARARSS